MEAFDGSTVVVTGAASGIGFEMARLFVEEGAQVFAADLNVEGVPKECVPVRVDVSVPSDVRSMIDQVVSSSGRIDVLCNNAGIGTTTDVLECSIEEWDRVFAVNVKGVFLGTKFALPHMLRAGKGSIVNTASIAGMVGLKDRAAYCASKGAVIALTKQVAVQYAGTGVRCNCICPGTVDSPWVERLLGSSDDPDKAREALVARQPVGRMGTSEEIARAALYLASDDADFVTGTAFVIDGGLTAG